ncbi:MAG: hypothetical protein AVDCRST_MAG38-2583 [uncultured Solirubrobacteraceae bacterium]|uniref:Uncharacterized protein n=1 Tax=uncultured Solirubrobacteraceae bacterium TaxID=1162706 RepID=A0A6J4S666_9ACTN|nr:MAG: hypothetical protein AVDCRST_MAG38-2583 [uncultured Solirubrobacteraceae bacterium]
MTGRDGIEDLLREALAPVEPPQGLEHRMESAFGSLVEAAADELDGLELAAMGDPRNWIRPAGAVMVGSAAAAGLVLVRTRRARHRRRAQSRNGFELVGRTVRDLGHEVGRVVADTARRR